MTVHVAATAIEIGIDDDEGLTSFFAKWGAAGQYVDVTRESDGKRVYCELFDQANGREFDSIKGHLQDKVLTLEVESPESFLRDGRERRLEIDLSGVSFDIEELSMCLQQLFRHG